MSVAGVGGIILAAGFSRRLGRPKQTVEIGGESLLQRAVRVANEAELAPVFVIIPGQAGFDVKLENLQCTLIRNEHASEGMASSIRVGIEAAQAFPLHGVVLMTCDQVSTRAEHLRALSAEPGRLTGSRYEGRTAVPAYFPCAYFDQLLTLRGDVGARDLLRTAFSVGAEELELDIDTEEDIARAKALLERM